MVTQLRHSSLFRLQARDQLIFTFDQLVNHFRPGLVQKRRTKYGLNCRLSVFLPSPYEEHQVQRSPRALEQRICLRQYVELYLEIVGLHCTERSSFEFHLPFFWWAVSWHSVMATERNRFWKPPSLSTLQRKPIVFSFIHLSYRFQCRNSQF